LEERSFYRVGGAKPVFAEFRLLAASHRDLAQLVSVGRFREDLFYRLNVVPLTTPPLRMRGNDVLLLAELFVVRFASSLARSQPVLADEARAALVAYDWPGNVRELRNVIERALVLCTGAVIDAADLYLTPVRDSGDRNERQRIAEALRAAGGKKVAAAKALGISRPTLDKKIAEYGLAEVR
jgi:DNA-binding NtrC family response regulator